MPFRKYVENNRGGSSMVIWEKVLTQEDLETNGISCIWLDITPENGKSFLIDNMNCAPDSRIKFNDRFKNFIDFV